MTKLKYELIILDRDGVINHNTTGYVKNVDDWIPEEGSLEAIAKAYISIKKPIVFYENPSIFRKNNS